MHIMCPGFECNQTWKQNKFLSTDWLSLLDNCSHYLIKSLYTNKYVYFICILLEIPPPGNNLVSLRHLYDKMETYIRGLESLGQSQDIYGTLFVPTILSKLPGEIKKTPCP